MNDWSGGKVEVIVTLAALLVLVGVVYGLLVRLGLLGK